MVSPTDLQGGGNWGVGVKRMDDFTEQRLIPIVRFDGRSVRLRDCSPSRSLAIVDHREYKETINGSSNGTMVQMILNPQVDRIFWHGHLKSPDLKSVA